ncbi:MAG: hypothetical protein FJ197_09375 [Gammaproteobacteria bacterium]|nr:hypothetical protein [Gammaproteobacteria bacterium]
MLAAAARSTAGVTIRGRGRCRQSAPRGFKLLAELGKRGYRIARRITIAVIGGTAALLGVLMIFTPGPGLLMIAGGLAILAIEFAWARYWLHRIKEKMSKEQLAALINRTRQVTTGNGKKNEGSHG